MESVHEPVLLHEVICAVIPAKAGIQDITKTDVSGDILDSRLRGNDKRESLSNSSFRGNDKIFTYLDGTFGGGGHAMAIAKAMNGKVNIIGLDRDPEAVKRGIQTLSGKAERVIIENENFRNLDKVLDKYGIGSVDAILLDLGISSDELENSGRGFSFQKDEPLLMTMGDTKNYPFTATDIVNDWEENVIADIIFGYGEERFARRIARAIVNYRTKKKIETSGEFAEIVVQAIPFAARRFWKNNANNQTPLLRSPKASYEGQANTKHQKHPATKTFQAIRIAVNDELNALREGLIKGYERLNKGGRMAVISFHSLEDRIVKDFNKKQSENGAKIITKKPITAGPQEIAENPRSRSAKLRIIEKIQ